MPLPTVTLPPTYPCIIAVHVHTGMYRAVPY